MCTSHLPPTVVMQVIGAVVVRVGEGQKGHPDRLEAGALNGALAKDAAPRPKGVAARASGADPLRQRSEVSRGGPRQSAGAIAAKDSAATLIAPRRRPRRKKLRRRCQRLRPM